MWILLRHIPKGTTRQDLSKFVNKGLKPSWVFLPFLSHAKVKRCEILQIQNPRTKTIEHHGLVQIDPSKEALQVIERLNGRELRGKFIEVRKYFRRSGYRDRRALFSKCEDRQELRRQDRRRDQLRSKVLHAPDIERALGIL